MINFAKFNIDTCGRTSGRLKTFCPQCRDSRKNKRDKSLSVNIDTGLAYCHYCNWRVVAASPQPSPKERGLNPAASFSSLSLGEGRGEAAVLRDDHVQWFLRERRIPTSVLIEAGITSSEQFMPQTGKKESCICFNYYEGHRLVNTKYRDLAKNFKMTAGAELIPYNLNGILGTKQCIITEGEMDALSFMAIGRRDVISVPSGANCNLSWLDRFMKTHFDDKEVIYICVDTDKKGLQLRDELLRRLGAERCRVVDLSPAKDANEILQQEHGAEALKAALDNAPQAPLDGVFTVSDLSDEMRVLFENGLGHGADTGLKNLDACCTFELGRLCVVSGIPGCGKSEFVDELVLRLNLRHHWKAAYFSPENMPLVYHFNKLAEKVSGRTFRKGHVPEPLYEATLNYLAENITSIMPEDNYTVDNILTKARELVHRRGIRILVIDPYNRLEHQMERGDSETQYISAFLDKLTNFAQRNHCLVILVAHPRKMNREPGTRKKATPDLYDVNGSANFFNKCDFGLIIERDYERMLTEVHVEKVKFKHLGAKAEVYFRYNAFNGRYVECTIDEKDNQITTEPFDNTCWLKDLVETMETGLLF
ncbi:bifunctional DNA primase/helicase [Bacteroides sp. 224]|uniref:bifunctional DNA primase/helicase n=1 Tax=Bacteroides sp. 224 TaxID=2302936 RepID=UPI0013D3F477|nr:bifunctional DNA primase/helicase [Bacteroides sp. 224]NDV63762.1 toprim domain-containing protein [Bacteroides sp. 224]